MKLLSTYKANSKTEKNTKLGYSTLPLHLAPADLSGYEVCPMRSKGCTVACLHTAGNPAYMNNKNKARIARTKLFFEDRESFMAQLVKEVRAHVKRCNIKNIKCAIRLNATSDIPWEVYSVDGCKNIMELFPEVSFYDYTKIRKRMLKFLTDSDWPSNYHLTFSRSEDNSADCEYVLKSGGSVAIVTKKDLYTGYTTVDGDEHDYRPADPKNCVVLLEPKGKARKDTSGFVL